MNDNHCAGRHRPAIPSDGGAIFAAHAAGMEPEMDFDWQAVEDPAGEVMEAAPGVTREQAEQVIAWVTARGDAGVVGEARLLHRVLKWISKANPMTDRHDGAGGQFRDETAADARLGIRAAVVVSEVLTDSRLATMSRRGVGLMFGVSRQQVEKLHRSFRKSMGLDA